jgi:murein DD-endopeptidase MepM/ murein hydrolase activator NlpD
MQIRIVSGIALLALLLEQGIKRYVSPVIGKIASNFGERINPVTGVKEFHNGVDIAVPSGTQVRAPSGGKVISVYTSAEGGNQLVITHTDGYTTGYAHLSKSIVKAGDKVNKGQIVAYSGQTGQATGPHLHLSLRNKSGTYINPLNYFKLTA